MYTLPKNSLFRLTEDHQGLQKGNLLLKGDFDVEKDSSEYFDMTYELKNGWGISYSYYNVPNEILESASDAECDQVEQYFRKVEQPGGYYAKVISLNHKI